MPPPGKRIFAARAATESPGMPAACPPEQIHCNGRRRPAAPGIRHLKARHFGRLEAAAKASPKHGRREAGYGKNGESRQPQKVSEGLLRFNLHETKGGQQLPALPEEASAGKPAKNAPFAPLKQLALERLDARQKFGEFLSPVVHFFQIVGGVVGELFRIVHLNGPRALPVGPLCKFGI